MSELNSRMNFIDHQIVYWRFTSLALNIKNLKRILMGADFFDSFFDTGIPNIEGGIWKL
jgi:hypothetical protein